MMKIELYEYGSGTHLNSSKQIIPWKSSHLNSYARDEQYHPLQDES